MRTKSDRTLKSRESLAKCDPFPVTGLERVLIEHMLSRLNRTITTFYHLASIGLTVTGQILETSFSTFPMKTLPEWGVDITRCQLEIFAVDIYLLAPR